MPLTQRIGRIALGFSREELIETARGQDVRAVIRERIRITPTAP